MTDKVDLDFPVETKRRRTPNTSPGRIIHLRLGNDLQRRVDEYGKANNLNNSQAIRVLLTQSMIGKDGGPDLALKTAAFREGLYLGMKSIRQATSAAFHASMKELEDMEKGT